MKICAIGLSLMSCANASDTITFSAVLALDVPGAEVVDFEPLSGRFWCTATGGVHVFDATPDGFAPRPVYSDNAAAAAHVVCDPSGSGHVVSVGAGLPGTGWIAGHDSVGGTPLLLMGRSDQYDCAVFAQGGQSVLVCAENEPVSRGADLPGALVVLRPGEWFGGGADADGARAEPVAVPVPRHLLDKAEGLRIHPSNADSPAQDVEPEYVAVVGDTAYVTLQENNAIGVFDIVQRVWSDIIPIPIVPQVIDASDKDGGVRVETEVACMPMPDQITHADGALFFPGEGDTRAEVGEGKDGVPEDHARLADLVREGKAIPRFGLERLKVCAFTGDTDGNGVIDVPHAFGSRALHKYDLETGAWSHTGSLIERTIAERFPEHFDDARSDDRGPEPEGITTGEIDGRAVLFVSIERPGAVMAFDTDLNLLGVVMSAADGHTGPEGLCFVPKDRSPLGVDTLAVAFEGSGHVVFYAIGTGG